MCGIFGFWLTNALTDEDVLMAREATSMLEHRGPDGQGEWIDSGAGIYFSHRRLAIVDLSPAGAQPMVCGDTVITYNGEIYNFEELREELISYGIVFSSRSDTEVLLSAWKYWGRKCLDHFDGMYSFAVYDSKGLHLVTDPFGEKPLYVAKTNKGVYFSSEPLPLINMLGLEFNISLEQVYQFLALGFLSAPHTGFGGLECISPATLRTYSNPQKSSEQIYWRLPKEGYKPKFEESDIDELRDILIRQLKRRMRADVPVGLFLSSGVDSALIAALISRELDLPLKALTVSFPDGTDEAAGAADIARFLDIPHVVIDSNQVKEWQDLPASLFSLFGVPNDNVSAISVKQMSLLAKADITVALGGVGGDEAFWGYNKYAFIYLNKLAYTIPAWIMKWAGPVLGLLPRGKNARLMLSGNERERFVALKNTMFNVLAKKGVCHVPCLPGFEEPSSDMLARVRRFDLQHTLPSSYLASVDRGSMRAGVEVRTPFLSRELFEFCGRFSSSAMLGQGQKYALKQLLKRYLPSELVDRPKRGFIFPLKRYFETAMPEPPTHPMLADVADYVWSNMAEVGADVVALRLLILDRFLKRSAAPNSNREG